MTEATLPYPPGVVIGPFKGEWEFLSNFYSVPILHLGREYPSVENAYQAMRAPSHERDKFEACSPSVAKRMGRRYPIPFNWNIDRVGIMYQLVLTKFSGLTPLHRALRTRLINTGDRPIVELNWWHDTFWGVCNGVGQNQLGEILMRVRKELR